MKQVLIKAFTLLLVAIVSTGCSKEDPNEANYSQARKYLTQSATSEYHFSESELATLKRLEQINDSIAPVQSNITPTSINDKSTGSNIIYSDVRGIFDGFRYGLKKGRGFWGKLSMAVVCSITYGAAYSMAYFIASIPFGSNASLQYSTAPTSQYQFSDYYGTLAIVCNESAMNQEWQRYSQNYPNYVTNSTIDNFKIASLHNLVLSNIRSGVIVPNDILDNFYSAEQLNFLKSRNATKYYSDIPNILTGSVKFNSYCSVDPCPYATTIVDTYLKGINNLQSYSNAEIKQRARTLSIEYIKVVSPDTNLDDEVKSSVISTMYAAPLSGDYWLK